MGLLEFVTFGLGEEDEKDFDYKKLKGINKIMFYLGWLALGNLLFWVIAFFYVKTKGFFSEDTYRLIYYFGCVYFWICIISVPIYLLGLFLGFT